MFVDPQILEIAARVFKMSVNLVPPDLKIGDVPQWDSLGQLNLIMEVEAAFGVRFDTEQIVQLDSLSKIHEEILGKQLDPRTDR